MSGEGSLARLALTGALGAALLSFAYKVAFSGKAPKKEAPSSGPLKPPTDESVSYAKTPLLVQLATDLGFETDIKLGLSKLLSAAVALLSAERALLFQKSPLSTDLVVVASSTTELLSRHSHLANLCIPLNGASTVGQVFLTGRSVFLPDVKSDPLCMASTQEASSFGIKSAALYPVTDARGRVIGVLEVDNPGVDVGTGALARLASLASGLLHKETLIERSSLTVKRNSKLVSLLLGIANECETPAVIEKVLQAAYEILHVERVTLFLVDEARRELIVSSSHDLESSSRIPIATGLAGYVATTGHFVNVKDAYADERFDPAMDKRTGFRTASVLAVAVRDQAGRIVGVLQAINRLVDPDEGLDREDTVTAKATPTATRYPFTDMDVSVLEILAAHAGSALKKAALLAEIQRSNRVSESLLEVVKCNSMDLTLPSFIQRVVQAAYGLIAAERISLFLVDNVKQELWMAVSRDVQGIRIPVGQGIAGTVALSGDIINIPDAYNDPRFNPDIDTLTGFKTKSILCLPLRLSSGQVIAVLQVLNKAGGAPFTDEDIDMMEAFGSEVALALRRKSVDSLLSKVLSEGDKHEQEWNASLLAQCFSPDETSSAGKSLLRKRSSQYLLGFFDEEERGTHRMLPVPEGRRAGPPAVVSIPKLDDSILSWDYDCFSVDLSELEGQVMSMFHELHLPQAFKIADTTLQSFVSAVRGKYRENPFHNFYHGFSVMHAMFLLLAKTQASKLLTKQDLFSCLVAALCHDIDHPGHNNAYEVNSVSPLALAHNDDAVLERHHAHTTFTVLYTPGADLCANMGRDDRITCRKTIISAILATDMSHHFDMCTWLGDRAAKVSHPLAAPLSADSPAIMRQRQKGIMRRAASSTNPTFSPASPTSSFPSNVSLSPVFKRAVSLSGSHGGDSGVPFNRSEPTDRMHLVRALIHTADLSGQAYGPRVARQWGERVVAEFRAQAAKEKAEGLPVAQFMAELETPSQVAKLQQSFISNITLPLWHRLAELFSGLNEPLANLQANRLYYEVEAAKPDPPPTAAPVPSLAPSAPGDIAPVTVEDNDSDSD